MITDVTFCQGRKGNQEFTKWGVVWVVRGHSRSVELVPADRSRV